MEDFDQNTRFDELVKQHPYLAEARDYGVDIQMLLDNSERTVEERIRRHAIALDTLNLIKNAKRL